MIIDEPAPITAPDIRTFPKPLSMHTSVRYAMKNTIRKRWRGMLSICACHNRENTNVACDYCKPRVCLLGGKAVMEVVKTGGEERSAVA